MELASKINEAFKDGRQPLWAELNQMSIDVFGESLKNRCTSCIPDLIKRLKKYAQSQMPKPQGKYRFSKEWEKKKVVVTIGGTSHVITAENLSNATAEAILNSGQYRKGIVELNPDYKGEDAVKKNSLAQTPKPEPISSTSTEAPEDGTQSKENVKEPVSNTTVSQPLTGQKKKRGGK